MSKFTLFKEVAAQESQALDSRYERYCRKRRAALAMLAEEADEALDRRRNRAKKQGKVPIPHKNFPPSDYLSLKDAALFIGTSKSTLVHYVNEKRIAAQKFNDPSNGRLIWYMSAVVCKQLKARKQKGIPLIQSKIGARKGY